MKRLGFVNSNKGWNWLKSLENKLEKERWNGKENVSSRKCLWFGVGVELGFRNEVYKGLEISEGLRKRGNELWGSDDWNSVLVYKYEKGSELKDHIDRKVFDNKAIVINFCKDLMSGFRYSGEVFYLRDGEVIEFNNKVLHGVCKVESERWSVSFRKVI
ncbi:hypothetical protein IQ238_26290 [Pleurocapsales cyanobacterium LEGE 06147]|nr:hypothetical protein [Pleurocapsales cyanobacterium LEGE 06147]